MVAFTREYLRIMLSVRIMQTYCQLLKPPTTFTFLAKTMFAIKKETNLNCYKIFLLNSGKVFVVLLIPNIQESQSHHKRSTDSQIKNLDIFFQQDKVFFNLLELYRCFYKPESVLHCVANDVDIIFGVNF